MPGNYDHPPASSRNASAQPQPRSDPAPDVSARLQHLRELLDNDRARDQDQRRRAMEALDRQLSEMSAEPMSTRIDRRRRGLESQIQNNPPMRVSSSSPDPDTIPINHTSSLMRSRRRPTRPSDRLQRHIDRLAQIERSTSRGMAGSLRDSHASPLPDPPQPPRFQMDSPDNTLRGYSGEPPNGSENHVRTKRRKLDIEGSYSKPLDYGHFGQVVPGPLKMQLVSCDGGHYSNDFVPEFVLKDDSSVYSTESNRANILIRHHGNMPFSLTKLVVKAPQDGYDAGIQQGMIFVSMDGDDLVDRTDMYKIKYSSRIYRARRTEPAGIRPSPSQDYLNSVRSPLRSLNHTFVQGSSTSTRPHYESEVATVVPSGSNDATHHGPPLVPGFHVSNEYDERNDDDSFLSNHQTSFGSTINLDNFDFESFIDTVNSPQDSSSNSSSDAEDGEEWRNHRRAIELSGLYPAGQFSRRASRHRDNRGLIPNQIGLGPEFGTSVNETDGKAEEILGPLLPHAKFFIPKEKYLASVKFDPPVSGTYILIKLWAACPNANIDIQSIVAYGYGGARFFPALDMH